MRLKKSWAKVLSSTLAVTIAFSGTCWMPVNTLAATDNNNIIIQSDNDVVTKDSAGVNITSSFESISYEAPFAYDGNDIIMGNNNNNHYAIYSGLEEKTNSFVLEADVNLVNGPSAALIFGTGTKKQPFMEWYGANVDTSRSEQTFRLFGPQIGDISDNKGFEGINAEQTMHFKLDVREDGNITYTFGNTNESVRTITGKISDWKGAWVGILTWQSEAKFSNILFENRATENSTDKDLNDITFSQTYNTNFETTAVTRNGTWEVTDKGLYSNASGQGDAFLYYSKTIGKNFVYSTDVTFNKKEGAAALIFRNGNEKNADNCYVVNIDISSMKCKFWRWEDGVASQLIDEKDITSTRDNKYTLKVVAINSWISYYLNDKLIASSGDYTLQEGNKGQNSFLSEGYFGLLNFNGDMVFQNTYYKEISDEITPLLSDIEITSSTGTVEKRTQFVPTEPITIQYVENDAETVDVKVTKKSEAAEITIKDADGKEYSDGKNIPVKEGKNYITITSSVTADNGLQAVLTYRVNVHRRQKNAIYYNELYRDQYHYSVKDGWANDPNGMVYYNGKYHLFYQFYDDIKWGPMHWAHVTSTDMIHWDEEPIALYPDANGAMFSGCIVVDEKNTSGFFNGIEGGGLVALITTDGNGQRIKLAYSTDEGTTWIKVDEIATDWSDDPLNDAAFRDPKVFRWENKWFMVVAGGPLRIYSSDNLKEWKCESAYPDLHTECPDLYPVNADDGTLKWVLSRGGRYYKVGDFKEVDGKWRFIADNGYNVSNSNEDSGIMNFGKDSYAAMTYYVQDFGTTVNPTLPDIIELNWMNTWEDYCNQVADKSGMNFNGTFNLNLKLGLKKENNKYVLTQTPVSAYESLRNTDTDAVIKLNNVEVNKNSNLLKDFKGNCYEIVSKFTPVAGTKKVGFKVRTSDTESTDIVYDLEQETLSIDRSKSGVIISNEFAKINSQKVTKNADGTIDLHIYVDRASVEVFTKGYTVAGANQIFPSISSMGASVFAEGEPAKADITIYPINSIWEKEQVTTPIEINAVSSVESKINVGSKLDLKAYILPVGVEQDIIWSVNDNAIVSINVDQTDKTICHVTGLSKGTATITATAAKNTALTKTFTVGIYENNFNTNIDEFIANGAWFIDDEILSVSNTSANDSYMSATVVPYEEYTLETEFKYEKGLINIFFALDGTNTDGAYTIQLKDNEEIRLFRFGRDGDIAIGKIAKNINDNQFHTVQIVKTKNSVTVSVDKEECLIHIFDNVESFYNNAYVGLGLWDGALEVKSFLVTDTPKDNIDTSSSNVVKGTKVTVKNAIYKVTSVSKTKAVKYMGAKENVKKAVIPATVKIKGKTYKVTAIAKNAFKDNNKLTKVTIGKNIKTIGKNAFKGCKNLKKIVVKTKKLTAKKVGNNAFKGINNKAIVKAPKNKVKAYKKIFKAKGASKNIKVTK